MTSITGADFMDDILSGSQAQQSLAQQIPQYFRGTDGKMHAAGAFKGLDNKYHAKGSFYGRDGNYHPQDSFLGNDRKYHLQGSFLGKDSTWHIRGSFMGRDQQYHGPNAKLQANGTYKEDSTDQALQTMEDAGAVD